MSKPSKQLKLIINGGGRIKAIYDDALTALFSDGDVVTKRASHVEPDHNDTDGAPCWCADMTPVGGPMLTNFKTRKAALAAEVKYLKNCVII